MRAVAVFVSLLLSGFLFPEISSSASLSDTLRANLAALKQTTPGSSQERSLQKAVIELVRKMGRTPPTPKGVRRHMARAEAFVESAKSKGSFERATREFRAVTRLAPWLAQAYFNLGVVQEKAGRYDAAMESFRMYIFAAPNAPDTQKVENLIYKIEARKEEVAAQAVERKGQEQAWLEAERQRRRQQERRRQEREQQRQTAKLQRLEGKWCRQPGRYCYARMKLRGDRFTLSDGWEQMGGAYKYIDVWIWKGEIHPGGRITGTYTHTQRAEGRCGNRPAVTESYPLSGRLQSNGRKIIFEYTKPQYFGDYRTCSKKLRSNRRHNIKKIYYRQ